MNFMIDFEGNLQYKPDSWTGMAAEIPGVPECARASGYSEGDLCVCS